MIHFAVLGIILRVFLPKPLDESIAHCISYSVALVSNDENVLL